MCRQSPNDAERAMFTVRKSPAPWVDVAEQVSMERLEVGHVVVAGDRTQLKQLASGEDEVGLGRLQLVSLGQADQVGEDAGVGIDVPSPGSWDYPYRGR